MPALALCSSARSATNRRFHVLWSPNRVSLSFKLFPQMFTTVTSKRPTSFTVSDLLFGKVTCQWISSLSARVNVELFLSLCFPYILSSALHEPATSPEVIKFRSMQCLMMLSMAGLCILRVRNLKENLARG